MSGKAYEYLFGPVPSRRLGHSLGVDLLGVKVCSYNCIYCQVGYTRMLTTIRKEWVDTDAVIRELKMKLEEGVNPDYITFSGSGEPTLHSGIGKIIRWLKSNCKFDIAVLTNSSLLWIEEVRRDIEAADLVIPSVDAALEQVWLRTNRPSPLLDFSKVQDGLRTFCDEHKKEIWLESLIVKGRNDSPEHLEAMAEYIKTLRCERVQLHTVTRPPAEQDVERVEPETLRALAAMIGPKCEIVHPKLEMKAETDSVSQYDILAMLSRRPCTTEDIATGLSVNINVIAKLVGVLNEQGRITSSIQGGKRYWMEV